MINHFEAAGFTVMGGVPTCWRTLNNDSESDPVCANAYHAFDIISPWSVGRHGDQAGADNFKQTLIGSDLEPTKSLRLDYMPVIFPGFSDTTWFPLGP